MKRKYLPFLFFLILLFPFVLSAKEITVAVAANAKFVIEKLKTEFENDTGIKIKTVISSSGKLTAQIKSRAPFDLFLSADMEYPEHLYREGFSSEKPYIYSSGILVFWTFRDVDPQRWQDYIQSGNAKKIAVGNPKLAPYGRAAISAMKKLDIHRKVEKKIVYGDSISQVNHYVVSKAADAGFTSLSIVSSPEMKGKGRWAVVDPSLYQPIDQGMIILKHGADKNSEASMKFYEFIKSSKAKKILVGYGYRVY